MIVQLPGWTDQLRFLCLPLPSKQHLLEACLASASAPVSKIDRHLTALRNRGLQTYTAKFGAAKFRFLRIPEPAIHHEPCKPASRQAASRR